MCMLITISAIAQTDTTAIQHSATTDFIQYIVNFFEGKYPIVFKIGAVLYVLAEALNGTTLIKANTPLQLIKNWILFLFQKKQP